MIRTIIIGAVVKCCESHQMLSECMGFKSDRDDALQPLLLLLTVCA